MQQLSLFGEEVKATGEHEVEGSVKKEQFVKANDAFGPVYHDRMISYIENGLSAKQICAELIANHGATAKTFSRGTPYIYPKIMLYLRSLPFLKMTHIDRSGNGSFTEVENINPPYSIMDAKFEKI